MTRSDGNPALVHLELSIGEVNIILAALGHQPYRDVYVLIDTIHRQAERQLPDSTDAPGAGAPGADEPGAGAAP